jgi:hypothetical protein
MGRPVSMEGYGQPSPGQMKGRRRYGKNERKNT